MLKFHPPESQPTTIACLHTGKLEISTDFEIFNDFHKNKILIRIAHFCKYYLAFKKYLYIFKNQNLTKDYENAVFRVIF